MRTDFMREQFDIFQSPFEPQPQTSLLGEQDIRAVVIDPPWDAERGGGKVQRGADRHYGLLSVGQCIEVIQHECDPWMRRVCDDAHVWIWVTNATLANGDAHELARGLGVRPITLFTWVKQQPGGTIQKGLGQYSFGSTEHLLFCRRGEFLAPRERRSTVFFAPRTEHSDKPDASFELIEAISPGGYLEILSRRQRPGWVVWGDEAEEGT